MNNNLNPEAITFDPEPQDNLCSCGCNSAAALQAPSIMKQFKVRSTDDLDIVWIGYAAPNEFTEPIIRATLQHYIYDHNSEDDTAEYEVYFPTNSGIEIKHTIVITLDKRSMEAFVRIFSGPRYRVMLLKSDRVPQPNYVPPSEG